MIQQLRKLPGHWVVALGIVLTGFLIGCQSGPKFAPLPPDVAGTVFHIGDSVTVSFISPSGDATILPPVSERIGEDGTISLSLIGSVTAAGKTAEQLQKEIYNLYVPKYFRDLSVTVRGETAFFYVDGEVQQRGPKEYPGEMTIVKAIAAAGGFTDFAKQTKVRLTRGDHTEIINVKKAIAHPEDDAPVFPGDKIYVPRRIF